MLGWRVMGVPTFVPRRDVAGPEVYIGVRLGRMQAGVSSLGFSDDLYSVVVNVGTSRARVAWRVVCIRYGTLGQIQIVILRVLHLLMLFCLIAGAFVGLQFLDKTHYLSMEVPLASGAGLCWLLAAALSLCDAWSTPPPRTTQWQSFLNCYAAYMTSYAVLATGWSTILPANTTVWQSWGL
jgi:purine-cytosine permease-like protein